MAGIKDIPAEMKRLNELSLTLSKQYDTDLLYYAITQQWKTAVKCLQDATDTLGKISMYGNLLSGMTDEALRLQMELNDMVTVIKTEASQNNMALQMAKYRAEQMTGPVIQKKQQLVSQIMADIKSNKTKLMTSEEEESEFLLSTLTEPGGKLLKRKPKARKEKRALDTPCESAVSKKAKCAAGVKRKPREARDTGVGAASSCSTS